MAFMFETAYILKMPKFAIQDEKMDLEYVDVIFV
jgi:hypothetical protein